MTPIGRRDPGSAPQIARPRKGLAARWPAWLVAGAAIASWAGVTAGRVPGWVDLTAGVLVLAALFWASARLEAQGFVTAVVRGPSQRPVVALTFDDGPDPETTPRVLAALARHRARATFFVVGAKAAAHPELVRRIRAEGHEVGSHGYDHRWWSLLSPARARLSIERAAVAVRAATAERPRLFRPPYGVSTPALGVACDGLDVVVVGWSVPSHDTSRRGSPDRRAAQLARRVRPGDIVLLHDAPERAGRPAPLGPELVEPLLTVLDTRGLRPVTVSELLWAVPAGA